MLPFHGNLQAISILPVRKKKRMPSIHIYTEQKCLTSSNKCLTSSNKKLLGTSALLVVTGALLVVTRSY